MRLVQFSRSETEVGLGIVSGDTVLDVTSVRPELTRVIVAFQEARRAGQSLIDFLTSIQKNDSPPRIDYPTLLANRRLDEGPVLRVPVDHPDIHRVLITGTGLTHTGSMESRDQMHSSDAEQSTEDEGPKSDSRKIFEMGLAGGKPEAGARGVMPEWFYKGNGFNLRAAGEQLEVPDYALDGGEEPEIVGCYAIDDDGRPVRLGFALGNEWSDHETENINYLYLAPSKLRPCAVGPELVLDNEFTHIDLRCTVTRSGESIYDSGPLVSGQEFMCHSLENCEDHHFKYPQHRIPGDVHLHYFGTSKLSHSERTWKYRDGDEIRIEAPGFSETLVNRVARSPAPDDSPFSVQTP